jgi:pimeloyl-ACP methyl ester carboxylesterase
VVGRRSFDVVANGLSHRVIEWTGDAPVATAMLLHGFMDAAATWDLVAPRMASKGLRVLAPDLRGFGDGARLPPGSYYYFPDYVLDVADLIDALVPGGGDRGARVSPLVLVGHSMGGSVATLYAGIFPDRVARLVVAEGMGPPDGDHAHVPDRMRRWVDSVRATRARGARSMATRDEALERLAGNHPRVPKEVLASRLDALARDLPDGRVAWKADPLHATPSPVPFFAESLKAFAARVECPVLFVSGGPLGWHPPDEADRLSAFRRLSRFDLPDAGHMMHWTHPEAMAAAIVAFAADLGTEPRESRG